MEINIENLENILKNEKSNVLIFTGLEGIGKTFKIKKILSQDKSIVKYINYEKGEDNQKKLLESLDLIDSVRKYISVANAISPREANKNSEMIYYLIMAKMEELKNFDNLYFVLDNMENMDKENIDLFFYIASNFLKDKVKARIIGIYNNNKRNYDLENLINVLKTTGALEILLLPYSPEEVQRIISGIGYDLPEPVTFLIYGISKNNLNEFFKFIRILENRNYIIEKTFNRSLSSKTFDEIREILSSQKENILEIMTKEEKIILLYLYILNENIEPMTLLNLTGMDTQKFLLSYENLIRKNVIYEINDHVYLKDKDLIVNLEKVFDKHEIRDIRLKIAMYFEEKNDAFNAGINYYYAENFEIAYKYLSNAGKEFYKSGDFYNALKALTLASSIKTEDNDVIQYTIEILKLYEDFEGIINLTKKILERDPENVDNIINYAEALFKINDLENSKKYYDLAFIKAKNKIQKARASLGIGTYFFGIENYEMSEKILNDTVEISREASDPVSEEIALRYLGHIMFDRGEFSKAFNLYKGSKIICENINNNYDLAAAYINMGNALSVENIIKGKYYYSKAREIAEKFWIPNFIRILFLNFGIINVFEGNIKESIDLMKRAIGLSIADKNYRTALHAIINLFISLVMTGSIDDAENFINIGENISNRKELYFEKIEIQILKNLILKIKGIDGNWLDDFEKLKDSEIKIYSDFADLFHPLYYFYSGDLENAIELYYNYIEEKLNNPTTNDLIDLIDFSQMLAFKKYFENGLDDEFLKIISVFDRIEYIDEMKFIKWNLDILKSMVLAEKRDQRSISIFKENIKNFDEQEINYLSAKLKIISGLYFYKNFNDKSILDEGKIKLESLNLKGAEKALAKAFKF
ncbi:MAG: hypothetical protein ACP5LA_05980 [Thermoplasmata archaeon]|nr:hypothetical protein [Thermoplasmata archaeon]